MKTQKIQVNVSGRANVFIVSAALGGRAKNNFSNWTYTLTKWKTLVVALHFFDAMWLPH